MFQKSFQWKYTTEYRYTCFYAIAKGLHAQLPCQGLHNPFMIFQITPNAEDKYNYATHFNLCHVSHKFFQIYLSFVLFHLYIQQWQSLPRKMDMEISSECLSGLPCMACQPRCFTSFSVTERLCMGIISTQSEIF